MNMLSKKYSLCLLQAFMLLSFVCMITSCEKKNIDIDIKDSPYKIVDTGYWRLSVNYLDEPVWVDNNTLGFASTKDLKPGAGPHYVKLLNLVTSKFYSTEFNNIYCMYDGNLLLSKKTPQGYKNYHGKLDSLNEINHDLSNYEMDSKFDCSFEKKKRIENIDNTTLLKERLLGDNYIEFAHGVLMGQSSGEVVYHKNRDDKGKVMPFCCPLNKVDYSNAHDAYIAYSGRFDNHSVLNRGFWILNRNGEIKYVAYPGKMLQGRVTPLPLKDGYVIEYNDGKYTMTDPGDRGLYLVKNDHVFRVIVGSVHSIKVSPDGCKVVFVHAKNLKMALGENSKATIKYINFCEGAKSS